MWKAAGSAEVQRGTTDTHLWQPNWLRDPVIDSEVARVEQLIRNKRDVNSIEAKARLVGQRRTEDVRFVERKDLAPRLAGVAKARDGVSL